jgi:hydrogenase/urease accessory protein HupE
MGKRGAALVLPLLALALMPGRAEAHAVGLSNGEYAAKGATLRAKLVLARAEVAALVPELDANGDGHVTALEVDGARPQLDAKILRGIKVTAAGAACAPVLTGAALTAQDGLVVEGAFACPTASPMTVELALLDDLPYGHRHVARAIGATTRDDVLFRDHRSFTVDPAPEASVPATPSPGGADANASDTSAPPAPAPPPAPAAFGGAWAFFRMGIEHILTGYDHMVFLLGLVLLRARVKSLLAVVTAFTVAHSISLALATLGVFTPSPRIVEPAIALSIAYVGIENFFVDSGEKRWRITFPFGLVHGFGFAGALREVAIPRPEIAKALLSFNLGVEAGQLAVMAVVLPLVFMLRERQSWFGSRGVRVVSGAVALAGGIWFVSRVMT